MSKWSNELLGGAFADPITFVLTCCCPCVSYGLTASKVHGGSCPQHGVTYCLSACFGLQGLFAGHTRKAIRSTYQLPQVPTPLGDGDPSDFLVHSLGILCCFALCQEANEIKARNPPAPLSDVPTPFVVKAQTTAPKQEAMAP